MRTNYFALVLGWVLLAAPIAGAAAVSGDPAVATACADLLPVPAHVAPGTGWLALGQELAVSFEGGGARDPLVVKGAERLLNRLRAQTRLAIAPGQHARPLLTIRCSRPARSVQQVVEDESYTLSVTPGGARLVAPTPYGVLRGIETLLQLVTSRGEGNWALPAVEIADAPRFPWRGLLIDCCRHFEPVEVLLRNLDAMAAVKLNVLHWHLSEDQGFRVESRTHPRLHGQGSDGQYYTQEQIRQVVAYARERGIRVVPEFDIPGHATSWLVGYPELAAAPGPYTIERHWGVFDPCLDPTREEVYRFLDRFFGEMAPLFPDPYWHVGGDEVNNVQWDASPRVAAFRKAHGLADNAALHAWFNRRLLAILQAHGKKMIGWDEILQPGLPKDIVIQSWRGPQALAAAARDGYQGILSAGWYLDHMLPAAKHYAVDPLSGDAAALPAEAQAKILGGEACMWAEFVTPEMIDGRIWPRAAAVAERLWSPANVTDAEDMYRRLDVTAMRLDRLGLRHREGPGTMLARLESGGPGAQATTTVASLLEPVKGYARSGTREYAQQDPLTRLVDAVTPESGEARIFARDVAALLAGASQADLRESLRARLRAWRAAADEAARAWGGDSPLSEAAPIARDLAGLSELGLRALDVSGGAPLALSAADSTLLARADQPTAELLLMVGPPIRTLVEAAARPAAGGMR